MKNQLSLIFFLLGIILNETIGQSTSYKFDFGTDKPAKGYLAVNTATTYSSKLGYGFMPSAAPIQAIERRRRRSIGSHFITSETPFYFSVDLPEGNYNVKIMFGDKKGSSLTTVRVENRRLMLEKVRTTDGWLTEETFTVNVRNAAIQGKDSVKLKPREYAYLHWDNQLTFEFCDSLPKVCTIEITPNTDATTIFLAGNSTVVDQNIEPYAAWGQMIPRFFKSNNIAIANHAESGETLKSFLSEKRFEKVMRLMKKNDYLFIEFAHNDQKLKDFTAFGDYKNLLKQYINETQKKGGKPVLVTSMHRRVFDSLGLIVNTLGDFPEAMRQTAKEENVPLIDLNMMSKTLWEALGTEGSKKAFVHVAANTFPNQNKAIADDTHFSNYGAYLLAQCMVEGIRQNLPELAVYLQNVPHFDPSVPMPFEAFNLPMGALKPIVKPDGS